ncbi:MAG: SusC/RagA family TonB-linked outer membrane protein [Bacteroidales bacterium]|nr:SusC/RagA family TonB-linked outer membrane protein [Bacteroidales bacterium]
MKKLLTLTVVSALGTAGMLAQTKTVVGKVVAEADGEPIIGASVVVTNTTNGTVTDIDGNFSVKVADDAKTLTISYVGMETQVVNITGKHMTISLGEDSEVLDDVVVVAYGTQRKTSLTGAIQSVKTEAIEARPTSSVTSALEGTVAGVQVNSTYGAPGSDPDIRIRGIGTVNGSSAPLYILDGVAYGGNISDLNPADIESISVLKDAASAALYGNRASNGVVLIQTKKGKNGRLNVSLDIKQGTYNRGIKEYERANAREWMEIEWQNLKNSRMSTAGEDAATAAAYASENLISDIVYLNIFNKPDNQLFDANGKMVKDAQILRGYQGDLDWFKEGLRAGYRQDYNLSAHGANDLADYRFSAGYLEENGYLKDSGFDRITASAAINVKPRKWIKTGLNVTGSYQNFQNTNGGSDGSYTNAFMYARNIAPVYPVHLHDVKTGEYILDENGKKQYDPGSYTDENGDIIVTRNQFQDRHVYYENQLNYDKTTRMTFNTTGYVDFILPYGFTATVKGNLNLRNNRNYTYNSAVIGDGKGSLGRANAAVALG